MQKILIDLATAVWTAIQPFLVQAASAAGAAVLLYVRTTIQRKIADAAVARAEKTGLQGPAKKAIAMAQLKQAHPLVRPITAVGTGMAVERAHSKMVAASELGSRPTKPD